MMTSLFSKCPIDASEPGSYAEGGAPAADVLTGSTGIIGGAAKSLLPHDPHVRRELTNRW